MNEPDLTICSFCEEGYTSAFEQCPNNCNSGALSRKTVPIANGEHVSAMNVLLSFTCAGNPIAKERPRVSRRKAYTPKKTLDYEAQVAQSAALALGNRDMFTGSLSISIIIRRKTAHRADIDNIIKSVLDGMEGVLYKNDSQVLELYSRLYRKVPNAGIDVVIKQLSDSLGE